MNRTERRKAKLYLPEEKTRDKMRDIFIQMGKFMLAVNDTTMMRDAMKKWYPYCRSKDPKTDGIESAYTAISKWQLETLREWSTAIAEDWGAVLPDYSTATGDDLIRYINTVTADPRPTPYPKA